MVNLDSEIYGLLNKQIGINEIRYLSSGDDSEDDFGKDFGRRVLRYYQHKAPEVAERKAELNDAYWAIDQIIYGHERGDKKMLAKGLSELLQTQAGMFVF